MNAPPIPTTPNGAGLLKELHAALTAAAEVAAQIWKPAAPGA